MSVSPYMDFFDELDNGEVSISISVGANIVTPYEDVSLGDDRFTSENINVIFGFQPLRSFRPNRSFNTLENIEAGKGILLDAKQSFDF